MEPDFGLGIGRDGAESAPTRPRPSILVRGSELAGLALVIYGLGSYRFGLVAVGGAMIVGSYALYRRRHGPAPQNGPDSDQDRPDSDRGSDGWT
jgi:hypothetical protein